MHTLSKPKLVEFWSNYADAEIPLTTWWTIMQREDFCHFNDLRATFPSADYVDGLTVFNIGGNKYRLIASIHYNRKKVYIRAVLTHQEYDRGAWKQRTS
jgi:mRNA interferase HigB